MANRIFVCAIIALWLGSMSWLMVDKILPSFQAGEPPMAAGYEPGVYVGWRVSWGNRPVGHAASIRLPGPMGTTNLDNRVVLQDVPLLDLVPTLMRHVIGDLGNMKFDASTRLEFDSLDNFSAFESRVAVNDVPSVLRLKGQVRGSMLELNVTFGNMSYSPHVPIMNNAALSEALFPDAKLPYLAAGRQWTEEVYNPFRSPRQPVETVNVEVIGIEAIEFGDGSERCMRVEFRGPPSPGVSEDARLQAIAWAREKDGLVLRQDVLVSNSRLRFDRLPQEQANVVGPELLAQRDYRRTDRSSRRGGEQWQVRREAHQISRAVAASFSAIPADHLLKRRRGPVADGAYRH